MKCLGISQNEEAFKGYDGKETHEKRATQNKDILPKKIGSCNKMIG